MSLVDDPNVPVLEGGWVSLTEAASVLSITRQQAHKLAVNGGWKSLRRVGTSPSFVVNLSEVNEMLEAKSGKQREKAETPS